MVEQANFSELRDKISNWDVDAEQMLLNKMQIFTNSYKSEFSTFTQNMQNLSNNLSNTQVEHYKAISNLKDLAMNRFIEEKLDENSESVSEESDRGFETSTKQEIYLDENEKVKAAMGITMKNLEEINAKKEKNKELIEDDEASVTSKKISTDNFKKYGNLPFIICTDDFMKDKNIGLVNIKNEEEEKKENENNEQKSDDSEDSDVKEFVSDIYVNKKDRKNWEKNKKKKTIQKKKTKEDNKKISENVKEDFNFEIAENLNIPKENEDVKVDNNEGNIVVTSGKGGSVPPPPPPPPPPVFIPTNNNSNNNNKNNINSNNSKQENINSIDKKIKNEINVQKENININNNISNNNTNNITSSKPINFQLPNHFLMAGLKAFDEEKDDDDEDEEDGIFRRKKKMPNLNDKTPDLQIKKEIITENNNININENVNKKDNIVNVNNNTNKLTITKTKLNNLFEDENDMKEIKEVKEEKEEDQKVKEDQNYIDDLDEPIKINNEMNSIHKNEEAQKIIQENQENNENKQTKIEDFQQVINGISEEKKEKVFSINQTKIFNSLFEPIEDEKNNQEEEKPAPVEETKNNSGQKKKLKLFFEDDD